MARKCVRSWHQQLGHAISRPHGCTPTLTLCVGLSCRAVSSWIGTGLVCHFALWAGWFYVREAPGHQRRLSWKSKTDGDLIVDYFNFGLNHVARFLLLRELRNQLQHAPH